MVFDAAAPAAALAVVKALVFGAVEGALLATAKMRREKNKQTEKTMRRQKSEQDSLFIIPYLEDCVEP